MLYTLTVCCKLEGDSFLCICFLKEIGHVDDVQTCQEFCKDLYSGTCDWFIFDRTTNDCKIFNGTVSDFKDDCREIGYSRDPPIAACDVVFDEMSENGCYVSLNFHHT